MFYNGGKLNQEVSIVTGIIIVGLGRRYTHLF